MLETLYNKKMETIKVSEIGKLLAATRADGFISFTAGVPAKDLYLTEAIKEKMAQILTEEGPLVLGYNDTQGDALLREALGKRTGQLYGFEAKGENVLITSGATQCIDICGRLFLNPGDRVIVEETTYIDAMNSLTFNGAQLVGVACDEEGFLLEPLKKALDEGAKVIYIIPDFQNPTGRRWSLERRQAFMDLVAAYDVLVIEDNPYGELYFDDTVITSLKSMDKRGQVLYLCSSSKIFCPGLRIGWIIGPAHVIKAMCSIKEKCDIHSSSLDQALLREFLLDPAFDENVAHLRRVYKERRDNMISAIEKYLPELSYEVPSGGFFIWAKLPKGMKGLDFLMASMKEKVAFVPGAPFSSNGGSEECIRLAFPGVTKELAEDGLRRMAKAYKSMISEVAQDAL